MKNQLISICLLLTTASLAKADLVSSAANGTWDLGTTWANGLSPAATNDYVIASGNVVSLPSPASTTFGGQSLRVDAGATLRFRPSYGGGGATYTHNIPNLTLNGGVLDGTSNNGTLTHRINNQVTVESNSIIRFNAGHWSGQGLAFLGGFTGTGDLAAQLAYNAYGGNTVNRTLTLQGASPSYSGNWMLSNTAGTPDVLLVLVNTATTLGTGTATLGNYATLRANTANALDSLSGISLISTSALLDLVNPWLGSSASLDAVLGAQINLGSNASTVGNFLVDGSPVWQGTYSSAQLTSLGLAASGSGTLTVVIPEPSSAMLLLLGLAMFRRRK